MITREMIPGSPHFSALESWAGELGTRLHNKCMHTYTLCIYNVPTHVHTVHIQCTHTDTIMHIYRPTSTSQTHTHTHTHTRLTPSLPAAALRTIGVSSPHSVRNDLTHTQRTSQTDSFSLSSKTTPNTNEVWDKTC